MRLWNQEVKMKKYGEINHLKSKGDIHESPIDELEFILWKAELNKELMAFWKSISK
jgi:hypothetical protein